MIEELARLKGYSSVEKMIHELYIEEGKSIMETAKTIGCGFSTVRRYLKKFSIEPRPRGGRPYQPTVQRRRTGSGKIA